MLWLDASTKKCKWCFDKIRITLHLVFILTIFVRKGIITSLFIGFELKNGLHVICKKCIYVLSVKFVFISKFLDRCDNIHVYKGIVSVFVYHTFYRTLCYHNLPSCVAMDKRFFRIACTIQEIWPVLFLYKVSINVIRDDRLKWKLISLWVHRECLLLKNKSFKSNLNLYLA